MAIRGDGVFYKTGIILVSMIVLILIFAVVGCFGRLVTTSCDWTGVVQLVFGLLSS